MGKLKMFMGLNNTKNVSPKWEGGDVCLNENAFIEYFQQLNYHFQIVFDFDRYRKMPEKKQKSTN